MKAYYSLGCFGIIEILKLKRIVLESVCLLLQMGSTSFLPHPMPWGVGLYRIQQWAPCPLAPSQVGSASAGHQHRVRTWAVAMWLHGSTELSPSSSVCCVTCSKGVTISLQMGTASGLSLAHGYWTIPCGFPYTYPHLVGQALICFLKGLWYKTLLFQPPDMEL